MVIRGNSRGNPRQLSHYLLAKKENEAIRILDVEGQINPQAEDLHRSIFLMGVSAELSKSEKGLWHAQINPAIGEDALMDDEQWLQAADILGKQLGLESQRRAIVLHTKKGRTHAHCVWERFDHSAGKMVNDSFSRLAQDRARKEMEAVFGQQRTPHRNKHRPELKATLTQLWNQTGTGAQFVKAARQHGFIISEGSGRSPFMVVDANGRSFDLTRQLQNVRLKEVRQRLRGETLLGEKDAITLARSTRKDAQERGGDGTGKQTATNTYKRNTMKEEFKDNQQDMAANDNQKGQSAKSQFSENKADIGKQSDKEPEQAKDIKGQFADNKHEATGQEKEKSVKDQFAENKDDATKTAQQKDKEKRREEFKKRMQPKPGQSHDRGIDID